MNIVISDGEYQLYKTNFKSLGQDVQDILKKFTNELRGSCDEGDIEGTTAENLQALAEEMADILDDVFEENLIDISEDINSFIDEIDVADDFMY